MKAIKKTRENLIKVARSFCDVLYELLISVLRFMYGDDVIVSFSSQILNLKNK